MISERGQKLAVALSALCCALGLALVLVPAPAQVAQTARAADLPELEELDPLEGDAVADDGYARALEGDSRQVDPAESELRAAEGATAGVAPEREWTVMVYMIGSNLESQFGAATDDFHEIEAAGVDFGSANVIAYTGGSKRWNVDVPNDRNCVLDLSRPEGERIVAQTETSADMGAPATLSSFVNWASERYPARHHALILWDHGGGPLWGFGLDELNAGDTLRLAEMRAAMEATPFGADNKLDLVGFDACLMGSVETARLWADFAEYLVASEEVEAGGGWDYTFLSQLAAARDGRALAEGIVDSYGTYYAAHKTAFSNPDATLAACDLSRIGDVESALGALGQAMAREVESGRYAELNRARAHAKAFGLSASLTRGDGYDLVDLGDLAQNVAERCPAESADLVSALQSAVVASTSNVEGANGLSVYFPGENRRLYQELGQDMDLGAGEQFAAFTRAYTDSWLAASDVKWRLGAPKRSDDGSEFLLKLSDEQAANLAEAYIDVLSTGYQGSDYVRVARRIPVRLDKKGVLHIPADPQLVAGVSFEPGMQEETAVHWCVTQVEDRDGRKQFVAANTRLSPMWDAYDPYGMTDNLSISLEAGRDSSDVTIKAFTPAPGVGELAGRSTIDASSYRRILNGYGTQVSLTRGDDGQVLPSSQWQTTSSTSWNMLALDGFRFEMRPLSECSDTSMFFQVCAVDVNGEEHGSELVEAFSYDLVSAPGAASSTSRPEPSAQAGNAEAWHDVDVDTKAGVLTVRVFDEYAVVASYRGSDVELDIPETVDSVPVIYLSGLVPTTTDKLNQTVKRISIPKTVTGLGTSSLFGFMNLESVELPEGLRFIGRGAFGSCSNLKHLELPATVESIGPGAFANSGIERLAIPASLQSVADGAFSLMSNLVEFTQEGKNKATSVRDGVLFSADGKTLLAFPLAREGSYDVPSGVEVIGTHAFGGSALSELSLPEGVVRLESYSLGIDGNREGIAIPDSVTHIATRAFGDPFLREVGEGGITLHVGKNVSFIGEDGFVGINVSAIEVDEQNESYASVGGFLTNKAKDTILAAPSGHGDIVVIPDGITTIPQGTFSLASDEAREFVFPNSAFRISARAFYYSAQNSSTYVEGEAEGEQAYVYSQTFHCQPGSAAETFAKKHGIAYDDVTDAAALKFETAQLEEDGTSFDLRVYSDHAVVAGYADVGAEHPETLRFPAEAQGVPVTAIMKPPVGSYSSAKTVVIPSSVESVDAEALSSALFAQRFEVDQGSEHYAAQDGALFTADGAELVAFPREDARDSYEVPDGTELIGLYAFSSANVGRVDVPASVERIAEHAFESCTAKTVELCDGLEEIGDYAFHDAKATGLKLPDTVTRIGSYAFGFLDDYRGFALPRDLEYLGQYAFGFVDEAADIGADTLAIGENLVHIGHGALGNLGVRAYEVAPDNPRYTSTGPLLIELQGPDGESDASAGQGRAVVMCAPRATGEVRVPDGVVEVDDTAFGYAHGVTDIYLPDSVERINRAFESVRIGERITATIHCGANTMAARYAQSLGMKWAED